MSNIKFYWDGDTGVCTYEQRKKFFTKKPNITGFEYTTVAFSEDENIGLKTLNTETVELTDDEKNIIKMFCDASATDTIIEAQSVGEHNADSTAHHDIRVALSNLHEYAHKVATVWSCEADLSTQESALEWQYILGDLNDCTDPTNDKWVCPATEVYDITLMVGLEGVSDSDVTITLKLNDETLSSKTYTIASNVTNIPTLALELTGTQIDYKGKLTAYVSTTSKTGVIVPSRTFLIVDNHGSTMAKRQAMYFYNTLGNHIYFKGYDLTLTGDAQGAQVIASKWNPDIIVLTE